MKRPQRTSGPERFALLRRASSALRRHPTPVLSVKTAVAAGLAWVLMEPFGGLADDYRYYAPLGAVVAMSTTVVSSVRSSVRAVAAIGVGAALALAAMATPAPDVVALLLVVGLGGVASSWEWFEGRGSWVPITALFVLLLGGGNPWHYTLGYAGMTAAGAFVGVALNAAFPQLPLTRARRAEDALRREVIDQLRSLAHLLTRSTTLERTTDGPAPHADGPDVPYGPWHVVSDSTRSDAARLDGLVAEVGEARRGNWRAGRWSNLVEENEQRARAVERVATLVQDVAAMTSEPESALYTARGTHQDDDAVDDRERNEECEPDQGTGSPLVRRRTAAALRATADLLEAADRGRDRDGTDTQGDVAAQQTAQDEAFRAVEATLGQLREAAVGTAEATASARLSAAAVAVSLHSALKPWR